MVREILAGAAEAGAETELVHLDGLNILPCNGCCACWEGKGCVRKDDMISLYGKTSSSEVLVFGTPVYWFGPTAMMKGFLDRFVLFNCPENRDMVLGMTSILAVPFEDSGLETPAPLVKMFEMSFGYRGMDMRSKILGPDVTKLGEMNEKTDILRTARLSGQCSVKEKK